MRHKGQDVWGKLNFSETASELSLTTRTQAKPSRNGQKQDLYSRQATCRRCLLRAEVFLDGLLSLGLHLPAQEGLRLWLPPDPQPWAGGDTGGGQLEGGTRSVGVGRRARAMGQRFSSRAQLQSPAQCPPWCCPCGAGAGVTPPAHAEISPQLGPPPWPGPAPPYQPPQPRAPPESPWLQPQIRLGQWH